MSERGDKGETVLKIPEPKFSLHEVLRYTYSGVLALFAAYLLAPTPTANLVKDLNPIVIVAFGLAGGAAIYAFQRGLLGWIVEPTVEYVSRRCYFHYWNQKRRDEKLWLPSAITRRQYLERKFRVPWILSSDVYRLVRDAPFFGEEKRAQFYRQHSEIHTLYSTGLVLLAASAIHGWIGGEPAQSAVYARPIFIVIGIIAILAGMVLDFLIFRQEGAYLRTLPEDKIRTLLGDLTQKRRRGKVIIWRD